MMFYHMPDYCDQSNDNDHGNDIANNIQRCPKAGLTLFFAHSAS